MRKVIIPFLIVMLLFTGYLLYNEKLLTQDLTRRSEAQYQKSFYELVWGIENIKSQLAQVLVTSSPEQVMAGLTNLWRETSGAKASLASIPVVMVELDKTQLLLEDIASYSYYLLKENNLKQKGLTEGQWEHIGHFYDCSKKLEEDLLAMERQVLNNNLSFVDLETRAIRRGERLVNHSIIDGFTGIEKMVGDFPTIQFDQGIQKIKRQPRPLMGRDINEQEALEIAKDFIQKALGKDLPLEIAFEADGQIPIYGVGTSTDRAQTPIYLEVTKKGGHIIQIYHSRPVLEAKIELQKGEEIARDFLEHLSLSELELAEVKTSLNTAQFTFMPISDGAILYSDLIKVQIALDNGEVLTFDQTCYLSCHHQRPAQEASLKSEEIIKKMNPNFKILQTRLAFIPDEFTDQEILVYEIKGQMDDEKIIIFVHADTGEEVAVSINPH